MVQAQDKCSMPNVRSNLATIISLFITDIVLLVVMLIGLVRMAWQGTGAFSLGRLGGLLWKQVSAGSSWLCYSLFANLVSVRQGLIWFLLATTVELQPLVRPVGCRIYIFTHNSFAS